MVSHSNESSGGSNSKTPNLAHTSSNEPLHALSFVKTHRVRTTIALVVVAILAFAGTLTAALYLDVANSVKNSGVQNVLAGEEEDPVSIDPNSGQPLNIVLLGQDSRDGEGNQAIGGNEVGNHQSDTAMIMQIAADRSYVNLVSIPRDSIVDAPACETDKGTIPARYQVMFNSIFATAYNFGGISYAGNCATSALAQLTGLDLSLFVIVDFQGLKKMIDTIGGVDLCIPEAIEDSFTSLKIPQGMQHLDGTTATQYARVRYGSGTGDGSDIMRTARQQYLIKALISQVLSKNLIANSDQLYQLVKAGLDSLTMSEQLADITTLTGLAYSLRSFNTANLNARTVPTEAYPTDLNRVQWAAGAADLWATMKQNKSISLTATVPSTTADDADTTDSDSTSGSDASDTDTDTTDGDSATTDSDSTATTPDPKTGLITDASGQLIDPKTGGTVDPDTGIIRDPNTGYAMGLADQYISATVCAVPAQN